MFLIIFAFIHKSLRLLCVIFGVVLSLSRKVNKLGVAFSSAKLIITVKERLQNA